MQATQPTHGTDRLIRSDVSGIRSREVRASYDSELWAEDQALSGRAPAVCGRLSPVQQAAGRSAPRGRARLRSWPFPWRRLPPPTSVFTT